MTFSVCNNSHKETPNSSTTPIPKLIRNFLRLNCFFNRLNNLETINDIPFCHWFFTRITTITREYTFFTYEFCKILTYSHSKLSIYPWMVALFAHDRLMRYCFFLLAFHLSFWLFLCFRNHLGSSSIFICFIGSFI